VSTTLAERIDAVSARQVDAAASQFAQFLGAEAGALAVLYYGSNLRTQSREGVLDFYVLLPGPAEKGIWPRVSYREWEFEGQPMRAKIATMTLARFVEAGRGKTIDTTIWARFVQPCALVWQRDEAAAEMVKNALCAAAKTAARLAAAVGPRSGREADYWRALFQATYRAELRVEKPGREASILSANEGHFSGLLTAAWSAAGIAFAQDGDVLSPDLSPMDRRAIISWWRKRRRLGKPLNILRLVRATGTFEGAGRYAAWKVERHTGMKVEVTPWRERHPILAAPGVLFRLWRHKRQG